MTKTFLHAGTFGDTIYSLPVVKILQGGDYYIELNGMDKLAYNMWGGGDAGWHRGRYTQSDIDFLMPLLEKQSYINTAKIWTNESIDYDLRDQGKTWARRDGKIENWQGNQTESYAIVCNINIHEHKKDLLLYPWLDNIKSITIPNRPIVINRTFRHIKQDFSIINQQYLTWIREDHLEDLAIFVGSEQEHYDFCEMHQCNIPHHKVSDMLELAGIIQGCEQFIGNQSMPLALAIALGKTFWCEIRVDYENLKTPHGYGDVWFPRANGHYF